MNRDDWRRKRERLSRPRPSKRAWKEYEADRRARTIACGVLDVDVPIAAQPANSARTDDVHVLPRGLYMLPHANDPETVDFSFVVVP